MAYTGKNPTFNTVKSHGGVTSTDLSQGSRTIAAGTTVYHPNLTIQSGHTYTVAGTLVVAGTLSVQGTLDVTTGTVICL